jgi:hypothetical protein
MRATRAWNVEGPPLTQEPVPRNSTGPPPRRRALVAILLVAALAIGFGTAFVWQHGIVNDRRDALAAAVADGNQAHQQATALLDRVQGLQQRLDATNAAARHKVAKLQARLDAMLGPALADGRYFGRFFAVGATQTPPRLVIDLEQFFTGPAAVAAAKEDGALPPGENSIPNDVYIRNESVQWRILPIDPAAKVSVVSYPFGQVDSPRIMPLAQFGHAYYGHGVDSLPGFPYWITVRHGTVVAIDQQFIP